MASDRNSKGAIVVTTVSAGAAAALGVRVAVADNQFMYDNNPPFYMLNASTNAANNTTPSFFFVDSQDSNGFAQCTPSGSNGVTVTTFVGSSSAYVRGWVYCQSGSRRRPLFTSAITSSTSNSASVSCFAGYTRIGYGCGAASTSPLSGQAGSQTRKIYNGFSTPSTYTAHVTNNFDTWLGSSGSGQWPRPDPTLTPDAYFNQPVSPCCSGCW